MHWNAERFAVSLLLTVLTVRNLFVPLYYQEAKCDEYTFIIDYTQTGVAPARLKRF